MTPAAKQWSDANASEETQSMRNLLGHAFDAGMIHALSRINTIANPEMIPFIEGLIKEFWEVAQ